MLQYAAVTMADGQKTHTHTFTAVSDVHKITKTTSMQQHLPSHSGTIKTTSTTTLVSESI